MKEFLRQLAASTLGTVLAGLALSFGATVLLVAMVGSAGDPAEMPVHVRPKTMLVIGGGLRITDTPEFGEPSLGDLLSGGEGPRVDLLRALEAIDLAAKDRNIVGILLAGELDVGMAQASEIRGALTAFAKSGKPVVAWVENCSQGQYYLASVAKPVYVHRAGEIELKGLASFGPYFGETLQRAGIGVQVTRVGKYKSAVEPFITAGMSDASKEQETALLRGAWARILAEVSSSRGIAAASLVRTVDQGGVFGAERAVELKLADEALHRDEAVAKLVELGAATADGGTAFRQISLGRYARKVRLPTQGGKIAVVYAEGEIVDGWGDPANVGGDRLAHHLRQLRGDEDLKAVVLRVNSPGGSAFASDVVAREVSLLRAKGVPVVASFGDVAASGGYYIAAGADKIIADRITITGSIGVFGLHFNYEQLAKKVGLATDGVKVGAYADLFSSHRAATPKEMAVVQTLVDEVYEDFLKVVADGRKMKRDAVHAVAQGRVWLSPDARQAGLVDAFGGLRAAVAEAQKLAKLDRAAVVQVPSLHEGRQNLLEQLLSGDDEDPVFTRSGDADPLRGLLKANAGLLRSVRSLNDPKGVYLRGPGKIEAR
ncbi:MAG: signal peptide peptidase SppA [Opitutales bacterium]